MFKAAPLWPGRSLVRECARFGRVTPIEPKTDYLSCPLMLYRDHDSVTESCAASPLWDEGEWQLPALAWLIEHRRQRCNVMLTQAA